MPFIPYVPATKNKDMNTTSKACILNPDFFECIKNINYCFTKSTTGLNA